MLGIFLYEDVQQLGGLGEILAAGRRAVITRSRFLILPVQNTKRADILYYNMPLDGFRVIKAMMKRCLITCN